MGVSLLSGESQQYIATGYDQFGDPIATGAIGWTCSGGSISNNGLFTAGNASGNYLITATDVLNIISGSVLVSVTGSVGPPVPPPLPTSIFVKMNGKNHYPNLIDIVPNEPNSVLVK